MLVIAATVRANIPYADDVAGPLAHSAYGAPLIYGPPAYGARGFGYGAQGLGYGGYGVGLGYDADYWFTWKNILEMEK